MTATSTTTASKNAGKLVASTASSIITASGAGAGATSSAVGTASKTVTKKIVLYNPAIDYSAPLPQQINPDLIGAHPLAQQYMNSYNANAGGGSNSNNQVRQPSRNGLQASAFVTNAGANLLSSTSSTAALLSQQNQHQQQQQQQQRLSLQTTGNLPLKLGEQSINLSNNFINPNSNNNFVNEVNSYKFGQQQLQLQQSPQQNQQQQQVGFLFNNGSSDSNGLLTNRSVNSSISNLLIKNNIVTTPTSATVATGTANNKFNTPWTQNQHQHQQQQSQQQQQSNQLNQSLIYNNSNTSDSISALWGCSSNASSTSSGCCSGSNSSQPSLSPASNSSTSRQEYRSNSKESLWSQTLSPISNGNINNLRDNYYANNDNNNNNNKSNTNTKNGTTNITASSPTASLASSTTSGSSGVSGLWSLSNGCNNSFFGSTYMDASPPTSDGAAHYSKISNIWEIPNNNTTNNGGQQQSSKSRSNDLFTDLWSNINNTSTNSDNSEVSSNTSSTANVADFDTAQKWLNAFIAAPIGKCLTMTTSNATAASTPKQQQSFNMDIVDGGVNGSASTPCMQLLSKDFLNCLNTLN